MVELLLVILAVLAFLVIVLATGYGNSVERRLGAIERQLDAIQEEIAFLRR